MTGSLSPQSSVLSPMFFTSHLKNNPFILAPLAGFTDIAFRRLCREYGAGLCYSEMISCHGLVYEQERTRQMLASVPEERPVVFQLFGADPDIMAEAAAILAALPIDGIDINMGCPIKKVTKRGAGSALLREPKLAAAIIRRVVDNSKLPVLVKIRSGWNHETIVAPEFAKMAEDNGAGAVAVHGRTWSDGFKGKADWGIIGRVKETVSIPVIGNGDVNSYEDGLAMMEKTGCDAVMVGRAALGNPWIFQPGGRPRSMAGRTAGLKRHLELLNAHFPVDTILARIKNHAGRYFKGIAGGAVIRRRIYNTRTFADLERVVSSIDSAEQEN